MASQNRVNSRAFMHKARKFTQHNNYKEACSECRDYKVMKQVQGISTQSALRIREQQVKLKLAAMVKLELNQAQHGVH